MTARLNRIKRGVGYAIIAVCWGALLALLGFFAMTWAIRADLTAPATSRLTEGTPAGVMARAIFYRRFQPIWQGEPACAQFDPMLTYVPKPGAARFRGPEFDTTITMLPEGPRWQPSGLPPKGDRVIMLGDSFTMGWGASDAETFSALLATRHGHPTVNLGVSSYGTARELLRLRQLGLVDGAGHLVIQYCDNDELENREFLLAPGAFAARPNAAEIWRDIQDERWRASAVTYGAVIGATVDNLRWRMSVDGVRGVLRALFVAREFPFGRPSAGHDPRAAAEVARHFVAVWDAFPELAGKPVIVTEMNANGIDSGFLGELERRVRDRPNFKIVRLNLRPADYFRFDPHFTPAGHASVAAQLDRALREHRTALGRPMP